LISFWSPTNQATKMHPLLFLLWMAIFRWFLCNAHQTLQLKILMPISRKWKISVLRMELSMDANFCTRLKQWKSWLLWGQRLYSKPLLLPKRSIPSSWRSLRTAQHIHSLSKQ
jgi:hypothetical protein